MQANEQTTTKEPTNAAELTGVQLNGAGDLKTLLAGLRFDLMMLFLYFCAFVFILLPRFPMIYKNNILIGTAPEHPDPSEGYFGFMRASLNMTLDQAEKVVGLDRAMVIELTHLAMKILAATSGIFIIVISPLYFLFGDGDAEKTGDDISRFSQGNVRAGHPWLWHLMGVQTIYVSFVVRHFVHESMKRFVHRRFEWLASLPRPRASTVLVEGIPEEYRSDEKLKEFFTECFSPDSVQDAFSVKYADAASAAIKEKVVAEEALKLATAKWEKTGGGAEHRPKITSFFNSTEGVDAIDFYTSEIKRLTELHQVERQRVLDEAKEPGNLNSASGFVTFSNCADAEMAKNAMFSEDQSQWIVSTPPEASQIIWSDLKVNPNVENVSTGIGLFLASLLYIFFTPICVGINNLAVAVVLPDPLQSYWSALAPTLGLTVFTMLYPTVMRIIFKNFFVLKTELWSQHKLQVWYFWFQVFFIILVTAVGDNIVAFAQQIAHNPGSLINLMAEKMPKATHFYMNYVAYNWTAYALALLRLAQLGKFIMWKAIYSDEEAKLKAEPEDQDSYGMGGHNARGCTFLLVGVVYGTLSPLLGLFTLVNFCVMRLCYGYQVCFCETRKTDMGGVFWVQALEHIQKGTVIYNLLQFGVLSARAPDWIPAVLGLIGLAVTLQGLSRFHEAFTWEKLPFTEVIKVKAKGDALVNDERYVQPELTYEK